MIGEMAGKRPHVEVVGPAGAVWHAEGQRVAFVERRGVFGVRRREAEKSAQQGNDHDPATGAPILPFAHAHDHALRCPPFSQFIA